MVSTPSVSVLSLDHFQIVALSLTANEMAVIGHDATAIPPVLEALLSTNNDIAAVTLALNALTVLFGLITVYGVYLAWKLYKLQLAQSPKDSSTPSAHHKGSMFTGASCYSPFSTSTLRHWQSKVELTGTV